jgi:hypothetical protein
MSPDLVPLLADLRQQGARRFAAWDAALFDAVGAGPAAFLWLALRGEPEAEATLRGYLRLVQEAIGTAALRRPTAPPTGTPWTSFLERCLIELVPAQLPAVPAEQRLPLLVQLWNLGEGLRGEPDWVDRYVNACAGRLRSLAEVGPFLVEVLGPVLTPAPPSSWAGPFAVTVLDLRPIHDDFLPGKVYLAAPNVLCVPDRRLPNVQIGVLLRPQCKSEPLGLTQGLAPYVEAGPAPTVTFEDQRLLLNGQPIALPFLRRCAHHAVARAGFVASCAIDSQRLWIVEAA